MRYFLARTDLTPLIYLPKVLVTLTIPIMLSVHGRVNRGFVIGVSIVALAFMWGVLNLSSIDQVLFGLWVLVPLIYGLLVATFVLDNPSAYKRIFMFLFAITALGVLLNPLLHYPWVGETLDIGGVSVEVSRKWSTFGIDRYAGFSSASFDAASQLLVFAIWLVTTLRSKLYKFLLWMVAGAGITLTTSKGPLVTYLLITLFFISGALYRYRKSWRQLWTIVLSAIATMMMLLPLSTLLVRYDLRINSYTGKLLFASFGDRLEWMWPDSLKLLKEPWQWIVGIGLGGIGAPQQYFDLTKYLAADNLFVYLCVDFGILIAIMLIVAIIYVVTKNTSYSTNQYQLVFAIVLATISYGVVSNVIENPVLVLFAAMALTVSRSRRMHLMNKHMHIHLDTNK